MPETADAGDGRLTTHWDWRDALLPMGLALIAVAGLVLWSTSDELHPYMHLTPPADPAHPGHTHHGPPPVGPVTAVALFGTAWLSMTVAHMLPTMTPLLGAFRRITAAQRRHGALLTILIAGFLSVWAIAGLAVAVAHTQIITAFESSTLQPYAPWLLVLVLAAAGTYQFTPYVSACLRACRSPLSFLAKHWHGGPHPARQAFTIGTSYGRSCLGCCVALMIVMFVVGTASNAWMLLFALLGILQKTTHWGQSLTKPIGIGFLLTSLGIAITGT